MANASINLRVQPYRLFTKAEAAHYCHRPLKTFERECPVRPISIGKDLLWDVHDLDRWIEGLKGDANTDDAIIERLR